MKKVFEQILTWFEDTFQDGETEDWYRNRIVDSVVAPYATKDKLKEELSGIIDSFQQEQQEEVDLKKEIVSICERYGITEQLDAELGPHDIKNIARYFYELGLNARKED